MRQFIFSLLILLSASACAAASPCANVRRDIPRAQKQALSPVIAKQLEMTLHVDVPRVDVLQSFRLGKWSIIYVDSHVTDSPFLFYKHNPLTSHFVTMWSGAAMRDEEDGIRSWVEQNAPGIPAQLARCFAWHVTKNRDL